MTQCSDFTRFLVSDNGDYVLDLEIGLLWQRFPVENAVTWKEVQGTPPTIKQLTRLADPSYPSCLNPVYFPGNQAGSYWSSTEDSELTYSDQDGSRDTLKVFNFDKYSVGSADAELRAMDHRRCTSHTTYDKQRARVIVHPAKATPGHLWKFNDSSMVWNFPEWLLEAQKQERRMEADQAIKNGTLLSWLTTIGDSWFLDRVAASESLSDLLAPPTAEREIEWANARERIRREEEQRLLEEVARKESERKEAEARKEAERRIAEYRRETQRRVESVRRSPRGEPVRRSPAKGNWETERDRKMLDGLGMGALSGAWFGGLFGLALAGMLFFKGCACSAVGMGPPASFNWIAVLAVAGIGAVIGAIFMFFFPD